jgi:hypothetical protein
MERQGYSFKVVGPIFMEKPAKFYGSMNVPVREDGGKLLGFANIVGTDNRGWFIAECFLDYNIPERLDMDLGRKFFLDASIDKDFVKSLILVEWPATAHHDPVISAV